MRAVFRIGDEKTPEPETEGEKIVKLKLQHFGCGAFLYANGIPVIYINNQGEIVVNCCDAGQLSMYRIPGVIDIEKLS